MDQLALLANRIIHVTVQKNMLETFVKILIFVPVVHVQMQVYVLIHHLIFHAVASIILWDQHVKPITTVLENLVADMEPALYKVTATIVIALVDTVAMTVK